MEIFYTSRIVMKLTITSYAATITESFGIRVKVSHLIISQLMKGITYLSNSFETRENRIEIIDRYFLVV